MQEINKLVERASALLADGTVDRVLGWKAGEFGYDVTPAVFRSPFADYATQVAGERLEHLARRGGDFDAVDEVAEPVALQVICAGLGVPVPDREEFAAVSTAIMRSMDAGLDPARAEHPQPGAHLARRPGGERDREHLGGGVDPGVHAVRDPVRDRPGLAGAGAGQHPHRSAQHLGHPPLLRVEGRQQALRGWRGRRRGHAREQLLSGIG